MKTNREILAAILQGDVEPLLKYREQQEGCIYIFNCFSKPVAYCIYPDLTVEVIEPKIIQDMIRKVFAETRGFADEYHSFDLEEMEKDLQIHPAKYYKPKGRHYYA